MNINPLYVLPNLFTAGSIFLGIVSIIFSSRGLFEEACWLVLISMILDGLDGRVARLTNTTSKFGIEFDSLADVVAFGVAPAMLLYFYSGINYGRYGILISAVFVIFGAIRLARFNISTGSTEPGSFIGLPIPGAAIALSLWILLDLQYRFLDFFGTSYLLLPLALLLGILMVSNIRYPSFKKMKWNIRTFVLIILLLGAIYLRPQEVVGGIITLYILYGIVRWIFVVIIKILFTKMTKG
ncbi:CDP-diacylglycerol--serine O-phosphatidyltransferase [Helicobacter mustelae]|uniref:CDP-diacylglycerol--serine O-phosphatidyltransferase n=1 Tax=Helicobacter mustelae (strain ATCC 43772 / CCUG 25715 / CIP 103759 / LMG 18044 / NCTC 12198 / R85-136P) TaxID=679897 RepID=D3UG62_HELM1|nr:CDP-diacylglycerol--serine O-phosphatidyltransferase [Helicobacter mustelae]CBG39483.1 CDP-diacylglycerol--serine O-phosphatidyltransferase [Helicobacter mustelae 12198]SQH70996.1 CDP-diacylglycerol--serine O-phosphatidyltransferase [Helicobacter mustelae]STP12124.1 CDP-diacylglycerol--serine O-phosphatidyltransferase [Helicobacter mustelae]